MGSQSYKAMMSEIRQTIEQVKQGQTISYGRLVQLVGHAEGVNAVGWECLGITKDQARALCPSYQIMKS
jgi:alkylated DNA nucleotide flippase Atl1